jgi:hypothetical protein
VFHEFGKVFGIAPEAVNLLAGAVDGNRFVDANTGPVGYGLITALPGVVGIDAEETVGVTVSKDAAPKEIDSQKSQARSLPASFPQAVISQQRAGDYRCAALGFSYIRLHMKSFQTPLGMLSSISVASVSSGVSSVNWESSS